MPVLVKVRNNKSSNNSVFVSIKRMSSCNDEDSVSVASERRSISDEDRNEFHDRKLFHSPPSSSSGMFSPGS